VVKFESSFKLHLALDVFDIFVLQIFIVECLEDSDFSICKAFPEI